MFINGLNEDQNSPRFLSFQSYLESFESLKSLLSFDLLAPLLDI